MRPLITLVGAFLSAFTSLPVYSQVLQCQEKIALADGLLQRAVDEVKAMQPSIRFQKDDQPCVRLRNSIATFAKTLAADHLEKASGYEFAVVVDGEGHFILERFEFRNQKDLQALEAALRQYRSRKLMVEANTNYDYFIVGNHVVFMVSSAIGYESHAKMFRQVQQSYLKANSNR